MCKYTLFQQIMTFSHVTFSMEVFVFHLNSITLHLLVICLTELWTIKQILGKSIKVNEQIYI